MSEEKPVQEIVIKQTNYNESGCGCGTIISFIIFVMLLSWCWQGIVAIGRVFGLA